MGDEFAVRSQNPAVFDAPSLGWVYHGIWLIDLADFDVRSFGISAFTGDCVADCLCYRIDGEITYMSLELLEPPPVPTPEPGTLALLGLGLAGFGLGRRRKAA